MTKEERIDRFVDSMMKDERLEDISYHADKILRDGYRLMAENLIKADEENV